MLKKCMMQALAIWCEAQVAYRNRHAGHRLGS